MASKRIPYATEQGIFSRSREFLRKNRETNRHNSDRSMTSAETPGVEVRIKRVKGAPMHLKSYQIDGRMLRTGAANFSASGLKRQDNDLIVIETAPRASYCRSREHVPVRRFTLAKRDVCLHTTLQRLSV
jgi:phosphatidylserine/phosphatidylglycerophosphate/cardiolipin synthase-like enzyme